MKFIKAYLLPGAVFQSVMIGGGYGTGRELVEFFTRFGVFGGLAGMLVATAVLGALLAATYEFARTFQTYDYRKLFQSLLGRGWIAFEILYILLLVIVLAVVGAAAGEILQQRFGISLFVGIGTMFLLVVLLVYLGRGWITYLLSGWAVLLYVVFVAYFVLVANQHGDSILAAFRTGGAASGWQVGGLQYALYSSAIIPAILFATRDIETRKQAVVSGMLSSVIAMVPAFLFHLSFLAAYPGIVEQALPTYHMLGQLGMPLLITFYMLALFGTLIQTGVGMIQGVIERFDGLHRETRGHGLAPVGRLMIAAVCMAASAALSLVGIINLVLQGYGTLAWGFLFVYLIPILTIGVYRIWKTPPLILQRSAV